ncbi:Signal peptide peptidase-like 2A, partial [Chelonia mydas]
VNAQEGILHASGNGIPPLTKDYCVRYNPSWVSLPNTLDNIASSSLENLTSKVFCSNSEVPSTLVIKDKAVVVMRGNCSFVDKARTAQSHGAKMLLIASKTGLVSNKTDVQNVTIPVALVRYNDIMDMQQTLGARINVTLYSPSLPEFDYSMVVIFLIAVLTVALGGYWSGVSELEDLKAVASPEDRETRRKKEENVTFTPLTVIIFVSCVILLGLLLLYDVFFVFITPFITKNGESIMIEVAAGPFGNSEKLPVVIRVPRLEYSALALCGMPFSLLGFGDIIVPGLLVAYCRRFDIQTRSSSVYYVSCTIAYAVGMVLTFVVLALMKMGQPALLYLVPCTLLTSSLVAWRRKEMKKFWQGSSYQMMEHLDYTANEESTTTASEQSGEQ